MTDASGRGAASGQIVVIMGVSGSGKTTIGSLLAARLGCPFADADEFQSPYNVAKMHGGQALSDADRAPWLSAIAAKIDHWREADQSGVMTCSALKRRYRDIVIGQRPGVQLVYLEGGQRLIAERIERRTGHFMPASLLGSQFSALEPPQPDERAITVQVDQSEEACVEEILRCLAAKQVRPSPEPQRASTDRYIPRESLPPTAARRPFFGR